MRVYRFNSWVFGFRHTHYGWWLGVGPFALANMK